MKCLNCDHDVVVEYDIWNQKYWRCGRCGLASWQLVSTSNNAGTYIEYARMVKDV